MEVLDKLVNGDTIFGLQEMLNLLTARNSTVTVLQTRFR